MDTISIIITIYAGYLFFCFVNNCILIHFGGFENDVTKQRYMEQLWFSDALFTTYNSICVNKYANKINAQNVIVIGDNEVSADSYTVKDMLKGLETAVRKEDIIQFFQKI